SISTEQFRDYAIANLLQKHPGKVTQEEFDAWLYEPGIPDTAPQVKSQRFAVVDAARISWTGTGTLPSAPVTSNWSTQDWVHFIEAMPETLTVEQMKALDDAYHFTGTPNGEIAQRWYPLAVRSGYHAADEEMGKFMQRVGRRKLIMPIYNALVQTPDGLAFAKDVFAKARPGYHPITTGSVQATIEGAEGKDAAR
ncbi:MAG TPA: leukotriene A4 hydrolase C-terminal domain-containing protein, partial [Luteimonas sp.]